MTGRGKHILVIDDDEDLGETVADLLQYRGFHVTRVTSARQGLEQLESSPPDLILLDYMMPEMSGLEFRQAQRALPGMGDIPVVLFTAARPSPALDRVEADAILQKPCSLAEIVATVQRLCTR